MFIYLSKKIAIPNNTKLHCLAWNREDGHIAVGGEDGLLKVLKLDSGGDGEGGSRSYSLAASSNLSMNQTLEGHTENIQVITWNETHKKLTTSDQNGIIIVWMMYKGSWYEEMINNRKKSTVVGMAWSSDGLKICIVYEDGAVIVGSVDGNRIWGKELKSVTLSGVQWSPDNKLLLFSLRNGEIHLYDNQGNFATKLEIKCNKNQLEPSTIVGLDWYNGKRGYINPKSPLLAICYENGRMQLMRNENDNDPVIIDTEMTAVHCQWNHNGSVLAVAGHQHDGEKQCNIVQFYTPFGNHIRTLKVPGKNISCCVWEGGSLRVALAVDSFVYFANIRPDYKWCYFKRTVVFTSSRPQKAGVCVMFWDTTNHQSHTRYLPNLLALASFGDHCVLVTRSESEDSMGQYGLILCNTLGTPVDGKYTDIEVRYVTMNSSLVIAASKENFILWHYRTPKSSNPSGNRGKYKIFHVDDNPSGAVEVIQDLDDTMEEVINIDTSSDPICCLASSDRMLIIGRESGTLQHYTLPHVALVGRYKCYSRPHKLGLNCNSTRLAIIDVAGVLTVIELQENVQRMPSANTESNKLERRDVWSMCWASDNPQLLAIMEKTRLYILKGIYPEEPMASSGYICSFHDLEIQAVLLDDVIDSVERPSKDHLLRLEVKSLRDTRQLLEKVGINEAIQFIEDNPHPRLWRLLAEAALKQLNLVTTESAFIRSKDYAGIQFVKRLQGVSCEQLKKALIATYFKNFEEAEKLYLESDRRDLAMTLRQTLGDWFRVIQIMKMGVRGSDILMESAWNSIGNYFADRHNWEGAKEYFEKAHNHEMLIRCYYALEDYTGLEATVQQLSEHHPLLLKIAELLVSVGLCSAAVAAYIKYGDVNSAVNLCVKHNQWDQAIVLAKKNNLPQISDLLAQYALHLLEKDRLSEAVELFCKANRFMDAAKIVRQLAEQEAKAHSDVLKIKKLCVYSALLSENHIKLTNSGIRDQITKEQGDVQLEFIESAWRAAEGYHLLMLLHTQLYNGQPRNAMITSLKLREFDDIIPEEEVYKLMGISASAYNAFGTCSKAFIKLQCLETASKLEKAQYEELAVSIFTKHSPKDFQINKIECPSCGVNIPEWSTTCSGCFTKFPTCMITGKPIVNEATAWTCSTCHHSAVATNMALRKCCPLCHAGVNN